MTKKFICRSLEVLRLVGVAVGIFFAFWFSGDPEYQFSILTITVVLSLAGLSGIEGLFFGEAAAELAGYSESGGYQRESAFNDLALALATLLVYAVGWGVYAKVTLMSITLIFLILSAINHAYTVVNKEEATLINHVYPIVTLLLIGFVLPFMINVLV
ncbi:MAG: DUF6790 family protein [Candidatus Acetothermia bacterium]|nr:hypothetical protein [Candidatus Bipolaricaulota bacterium]